MMLNKVRAGLVVSCLLLSSLAIAANPKYSNCRASVDSKGNIGAPLCDLSFTSIPTFACKVSSQTGTFTVTNNTPVTMKINYVRLQNNDVQPASAATITSNSCGSSLAPGASCNIVVTLSSLIPFNRILQVGVNSRQVELDSPVITQTTNCGTASAVSGSFPCALNSLSSFAALAGQSISNTGNTILNGNVGIYPNGASSVTGFPPGVINGTLYAANSTALTAQNDLTTLTTCLQAQACTQTIGTADLSGQTLTSTGVGAVNVYCSGSTILNTGTLTLSGDASSVFIFNAGTSLTMNNPAKVVLTGGATAANVFWVNGASATLTGAVAFQGTLIGSTGSISTGNGTTILGRELVRQAGSITYINTVSSLP